MMRGQKIAGLRACGADRKGIPRMLGGLSQAEGSYDSTDSFPHPSDRAAARLW